MTQPIDRFPGGRFSFLARSNSTRACSSRPQQPTPQLSERSSLKLCHRAFARVVRIRMRMIRSDLFFLVEEKGFAICCHLPQLAHSVSIERLESLCRLDRFLEKVHKGRRDSRD